MVTGATETGAIRATQSGRKRGRYFEQMPRTQHCFNQDVSSFAWQPKILLKEEKG
jgi:hypothetical protein